MLRDACVAYVDSSGTDWCSLLASELPQIISVPCRIRPSAGRSSTPALAAADGGAAGSRWRATVLALCKAMRVMPLGLQRPARLCNHARRGSQALYCIATRGSAYAATHALFPHSRAENLCHNSLGSRPPVWRWGRPRTGDLALSLADRGRQPRLMILTLWGSVS